VVSRTFPGSLAGFREHIKERGARLFTLAYAEVSKLANAPVEHLIFDRRPATIAVIVETQPSGGIRVVVQGFMKGRWFPGSHVALDGFYKYPDETIAPMPEDEFYQFD